MMMQTLAIGVLVYALVTAVVLAIVVAVVIGLPAAHFSTAHASQPRSWTAARIGKNGLGALLVVAGLVMALPGVPGQGLLTMLAGALIMDIPGKLRLERRLVARHGVLSTLNRIRARFGKEPLAPPDDVA